jgi:hypothetical protein
MKTFAFFLSVLALAAQCAAIHAAPLSDKDAAFLKRCKANPRDIEKIPQLSAKAQGNIKTAIGEADCKSLYPFLATREYLKKYTPPPAKLPDPPLEYDSDYLTAEELAYTRSVNRGILDRILEMFGKKR